MKQCFVCVFPFTDQYVTRGHVTVGGVWPFFFVLFFPAFFAFPGKCQQGAAAYELI